MQFFIVVIFLTFHLFSEQNIEFRCSWPARTMNILILVLNYICLYKFTIEIVFLVFVVATTYNFFGDRDNSVCKAGCYTRRKRQRQT